MRKRSIPSLYPTMSLSSTLWSIWCAPAQTARLRMPTHTQTATWQASEQPLRAIRQSWTQPSAPGPRTRGKSSWPSISFHSSSRPCPLRPVWSWCLRRSRSSRPTWSRRSRVRWIRFRKARKSWTALPARCSSAPGPRAEAQKGFPLLRILCPRRS